MRWIGFIVALVSLAALPAVVVAEQPALTLVFQKQKDPATLQASADRVAELLSREMGRKVNVVIPGEYSASVAALNSGKADAAYVSALPFLLAKRDGGARLLLAEVRRDDQGVDRTDYDSIFVARVDSPLNSFDDLKAGAKDTRIVFTSPTSTSGYIVPLARLIRENILAAGQDPKAIFKQSAFGGGYTQALQQVIDGRADVAAVSDYTLLGPKADVYLPAEQRSKLKVIARTPGVPTHLICTRGGLDEPTRNALKAALLKLSQNEPGLLADVYGATKFAEVDEAAHVKGAVEAIQATGLPIEVK
jgi:phosphonate transport system substrate-binding protein